MNKTSIKKELDFLFYDIQHKIRRHCLVCGDPNFEVHHLIPKNHMLTAWDIDNGVPLCPRHHRTDKHLSAHGHPHRWLDWLKEYHPAHYMYIQVHKQEKATSLPISWYQQQMVDLQKYYTTRQIRVLIEGEQNNGKS